VIARGSGVPEWWDRAREGAPAQGAPGRWERLFGEVEAGIEDADRAEFAVEVADHTRGEVGRLRLADRLRAAVGHQIGLVLPAEQTPSGVLKEVGPDWLLLAEPPAREVLVPLAAVSAVRGLGAHSMYPGSEGRVAATLDLRYALRRLARDRAPLIVTLAHGGVLSGTCDRVGADFVELAEHAPEERRRASAVQRVSTVPLSALVMLRAG